MPRRMAYQAATALGDDEQRSLALSVVSSTHAVRGETAEADRTARLGLCMPRGGITTKDCSAASGSRCLGRIGRPRHWPWSRTTGRTPNRWPTLCGQQPDRAGADDCGPLTRLPPPAAQRTHAYG